MLKMLLDDLDPQPHRMTGNPLPYIRQQQLIPTCAQTAHSISSANATLAGHQLATGAKMQQPLSSVIARIVHQQKSPLDSLPRLPFGLQSGRRPRTVGLNGTASRATSDSEPPIVGTRTHNWTSKRGEDVMQQVTGHARFRHPGCTRSSPALVVSVLEVLHGRDFASRR
jgi:hypothetical protein